MTPETLAALIRRKDADGIVVALAPLDEPARRALAPAVYKLFRAIAKGEPAVIGEPGTFDKLLAPLAGTADANDSFHLQCTAAIAVLGCCTLTEVKRLRFFDQHKQAEAIVRVVADRRPAWASAWLNHCMDARNWPLLNWAIARRFVLEGICERPTSPGYIREMAQSLALWNRRQQPSYEPISARLLAAPDLLTHEVWRLFEVETLAFGTDWMVNMRDLPANYENWPMALANLAAQGRLDRARLLDASLEGLWCSENGTFLGNLCRFHLHLTPTTGEIAARAERYAELLRHRTGHVVGFALARIGPLLDEGALEWRSTLPRMAPVFDLRAKSHPLAALKILHRGLARDATLAETLLPVLEAALIHPALNVQTAALALAQECMKAGTATMTGLLAGRVDDLAPSVRARVDAMLGVTFVENETRDVTPPRLDSAALAHFPNELRERLGLVGAAGELPPPLRFDSVEVPQLIEVTPLSPLPDLESLIDSAAHAVELAESAAQVELLIDGISRLCDQRPVDFELRTAALARRLKERSGSTLGHGVIAWGVPAGLRELLGAWLFRGWRLPPLPGLLHYRGPARLLQNRLRELCARVSRGVAAPLLAAPTHEGGWIAAGVLVARMRALQAQGLAPLALDFQQALLRLAPDARAEALIAAADLEGTPGQVLRYALGAATGPSARDRAHAPWWVAAARARWPTADLALALAPLRLPSDWPGLLTTARYTWRSELKEFTTRGQRVRYPMVTIETTPAFPHRPQSNDQHWVRLFGLRGLLQELKDAGRTLGGALQRVGHAGLDALRSGQVAGPLAFATVAAHEPLRRHWRLTGYTSRWSLELLGWTQPLQGDALLASAVSLLLARIDLDDATGEPNYPFLLPLLAPDRAWTEPGRLALSIAVVSKESALRSVAIDAWIAGIDDGRVHPDEFAPVLARLAEGGWMKRKRLAAAWTSVARTTPLHALTVLVLCEQFLHRAGAITTDDLPLLELVNEQLVRFSRPVNPALKPLLTPLHGSSKTGRLAREICEFSPPAPTESYHAARHAAVLARCVRGERWLGSSCWQASANAIPE